MPGNLSVVEISENFPSDWCAIFNTYRFFELHKTKSSFYFVLKDTESGLVLGLCHFTETEPGIYKSPGKGTFGGFEMRDDDFESLTFFVNNVEECLKQRGAKQIQIASAPFQHNQMQSSQLFNILYNSGFAISNQEINYALDVDDTELIEKMNRNNKKRLKKCIREDFRFEQVVEEAQFKDVYEIIAINREHKGYPVSMTLPQIIEMNNLFPDSIYFFKAAQSNADAASAICVRINKEVLYVFYWGDMPGYEQHSPISFLADGIYRFARERGYKLLDAGISTLKGVPNSGLMRFKKNLGFRESLKLTYAKNL